MPALKTYRAKRDFKKTPEPRGAARPARGHQYIIQKHAARTLHYDLRLELDGVMLSWAVAKGPSLVPGEKRLAIHVEDHPIEYNKFEGTIPKGEYGGGTVMVWDRGTWSPEGDPRAGLKKGRLDFRLDGEKLKGRWHLVRMRKRPGERQESWLLIKSDDEAARGPRDPDILEEKPLSVVTGRSIPEIAAAGDKQWHSNRPAKAASKSRTKVAEQPEPAKARARAPRKRTTKRSTRSKSASVAADKIPGARKARLPAFVPPCLATLSATAPASGEWIHEIKFDGYRMQARIADGKATLKTRTGLDWTEKFPTIAEACARIPHAALIDGEIISGTDAGASDFSALQDDLKRGRHDRLVYYVFDLLHLDGYDVTSAKLIDRKEALRQVVEEVGDKAPIRFSDHFEESGPVMLDHACRMHLEGIVSKRRDASYRSGRLGYWIKTKCASSQELIIAGYGPSDVAPKRVRSLALGYYEDGMLQYAGRVGTGFTDTLRNELWQRLEPLRIDKSPFGYVPQEERGRKVFWVEPRLVAEIDFRGWTGGGHVRQASFKGLREDKPAKQVVRETSQMAKTQTKRAALRQKAARKTRAAQPARKPARGAPQTTGVKLTHPDRVYWEDVGLTKQDLADYYTRIWDWIAPQLADRPVALVRCPEGASTECFFQKHASAGLDAKYLRLVPDKGNESFIAVPDLKGLIALVQAGVLEIHAWGTTADALDTCDRLVFDLDPGPEVAWPTVIAGAREVRKRLADLDLESFLKTTGGKGLHVVVPIKPTDWDSAKDFAHQVALDMAREAPDRYTANMAKRTRVGRIFVDYLRNGRGATAIVAYSTRARPGATVSTPLSWDELGSLSAPNTYNVLNLPKRLDRLKRDPWADIGRIRQRLPDKPSGRR